MGRTRERKGRKRRRGERGDFRWLLSRRAELELGQGRLDDCECFLWRNSCAACRPR